MKYIITIVKKIMGKGIAKSIRQMENRIDLSNEVHCGPCGQYILSQSKTNKDK